MSADETDPSTDRSGSTSRSLLARADTARTVVQSVIVVAVAANILAAAIGLRMALHATLINCPNGTYFPEGTTDFRCFAHKNAGEGTVLVLFAVVFAVLVLLVGYIALHDFEGEIAESETE